MADQLAGLKKGLQVSQIAYGAMAFLAPGLSGKVMGAELDPAGRLAMRVAGTRDVVLGLGGLLGERHGSARGWYEATAAACLGDAFALSIAGFTGVLPKARAAGWVAASVAYAGLAMYLARSGDDNVDALDAELAALTGHTSGQASLERP